MARDPIGFIYFIQAPINGRIKIGYSASHPAGRIAAIEAMSPVDVVPLAVARGLLCHEAALHRLFAAFLAKGEWFEGHDLIAAYAREMALPWTEVDRLVAECLTREAAYAFLARWTRRQAEWAKTHGLDPQLVVPMTRGFRGSVLSTMSMYRTMRFQGTPSSLLTMPPQGIHVPPSLP